MAEISAEIDASAVLEMLERAGAAIPEAVEAVSDMLRQALGETAPQGATGDLASRWQVEREDELTWRATSLVHYAHMVAGGTAPHGPRRAQAMRLAAVGDGVFATWVAGTPARPFHDEAIERVERRAEELLSAALAGVSR